MVFKIIKWPLIIIGIIAIVWLFIFIRHWAIVIYDSGIMDTSSKQELIDNYKKKQNKILDLKSYFKSIVPTNYIVRIEFNKDESINLNVSEITDSTDDHIIDWFDQWGIDPYNYVIKSPIDSSKYAPKTTSLELIKQKLKWNDNTINKIKVMLDNANCISVNNREPCEIEFARSGTGGYFYVLFDEPIPDNLKAVYNDSCKYIYYNNRLVLEWGSGVLGVQCFPDK